MVIKICSWEQHGDQDLFVGATWGSRSVRGRLHLHASPTLHQLFRCKRSATVEWLQEGKLDLTILICIFLDPFLGLAFVVPNFFCFLLRIPTDTSSMPPSKTFTATYTKMPSPYTNNDDDFDMSNV